MEKSAFWRGFTKQAGGAGGRLSTALNVGALGALAAPSAYHAATGKEMSKNKYHALELGGLGTLIGTELAPHVKKLLRRGK